ncbi:GntR family transcriptional regulator [Opitutaceae bacterium EW11]|nr:GntR family transcriptional regulator [Opitutaceae bacterium EW11]
MALIGRYNRLVFLHEARPGAYLDGGDHGEILLPGRYIPDDARPGDVLDVFVYRDSEDRLLATREKPYATVGEYAYLRVVGVSPSGGCFLDWGLDKDLLLPAREQTQRLQNGAWVVVHVGLDSRTDRVIASMRLDRWLDPAPPAYEQGQKVDLLISGETELGYKAIINHRHVGLLYRGELGTPLAVGQRMPGYIRGLRSDGKVDLGLDATGYARVAPLSDRILEELKRSGGRLPFNDDSSPAEIREALGMSKKAFKQAVGGLYRSGAIRIEKHGISLVRRPGS